MGGPVFAIGLPLVGTDGGGGRELTIGVLQSKIQMHAINTALPLRGGCVRKVGWVRKDSWHYSRTLLVR